MAARIEMTRTAGSVRASSGSRSHGEWSERNFPGTGEYGIEGMCSSAHAHGGRRSGGLQTSRQIESRAFMALRAVVGFHDEAL